MTTTIIRRFTEQLTVEADLITPEIEAEYEERKKTLLREILEGRQT